MLNKIHTSSIYLLKDTLIMCEIKSPCQINFTVNRGNESAYEFLYKWFTIICYNCLFVQIHTLAPKNPQTPMGFTAKQMLNY